MLASMSAPIRWRENAAVILLNLAILGGFMSRIRDPRLDAIRVEPPPTMTPAPAPTEVVLRVYVSGEVSRPGVVDLPDGARVDDAVRGVGGFTADAARDHINLASALGDGQQIHVPRRDEVAGRPPDGLVPGGVGPAGGGIGGGGIGGGGIASIAGVGGVGGVGEVTADGLIDINRADAAALDALPGVGPALAARIVAHREANGPFAGVEALVDVAGIGPKTLERMRAMVVVR